MPEELNYCKHCGEWKPFTPEYFFHYHNKKWPEGRVWIHKSICLKCENENNKKRAKAKYIPKLAKPRPAEIVAQRELLKKLETQAKSPTRVCTGCGHEYPLTDEYFYRNRGILQKHCRECDREKNAAHRIANGQQKGDGVWPILPLPGQYHNKEEKDELFQAMQAMGWIYCVTTQIWYKPKLKSLHGVWEFEKTRIYNERRKARRQKDLEGQG